MGVGRGSGWDALGSRRRVDDHQPADGDLRRPRGGADADRRPPGVPIDVVCDSTYVVNCFRDRWWVKWEANGWRTTARKPVANADLWAPLVALVKDNPVTFRWVKGHSGDRLNDLVDQLAVAAIPR